MAALLHDVMEDQDVKKDELIERFGAPVATLVDGLSKLEKIEFQSLIEAQAENFRKMLLAMASDVRVILIKLADRLHNMRTLEHMAPAKKRRIAAETMEVYVPIAHRLGLNNIYRELQDLAFSHLYPLRYRTLAKAVKAARGNRREVVKKILESVKTTLARRGHPGRSLRPRKDPVRHLQEDAQQAPVVLAGARRVWLPRGGRQLRQLLRGAGHPARPVQADAGQVQGLHRDPQAQWLPVAAHHPDRPLRHAGRIPDPHPGNAPHRRIGRGRALAVQDRRLEHVGPAAEAPTPGCSRCSTSSSRPATRPNSSNTSRSTCSPIRSTCSRRSRRSSRCRAAPPRSISPTPSTPASATIRYRSRSTTRPRRCAPNCATATSSKSSPTRIRARARPGWPLSAPARRARRSATTCARST